MTDAGLSCYFKVKMREGTKAGAAAQAYLLPLLHTIANMYKGAIVLQMPVVRKGSIGVLQGDAISLANIFFTGAAGYETISYKHDHSASCSHYRCARLHFK